MVNKVLVGLFFLCASIVIARAQRPFVPFRFPGTDSHFITASHCDNYQRYDRSRTAAERCHDGLVLQQRILHQRQYGVGTSLLPAIYDSSTTTLTPSEQLDWQDAMHQTLASLIKLLDVAVGLQSLNPPPELTLAVVTPIFAKTCEWLSSMSFVCNPDDLQDVKFKLELYQTINEAVGEGIVGSPLSSLLGIARISGVERNLNMCNYWSSHVLNNCTQLGHDGVTQLHTVLTTDLRSSCLCPEYAANNIHTAAYCCVRDRSNLLACAGAQ